MFQGFLFWKQSTEYIENSAETNLNKQATFILLRMVCLVSFISAEKSSI